MRIPPYFNRKGYQRFFSGIMLGFIIGWLFFLMQYGMTVEHYVSTIKEQSHHIADLKEQIAQWKSTYEKSNEDNEKKLRVQKIKVFVTNNHTLKLSQLTIYEISESVQDQLENLLGEDIESIYKTRMLLYKAIENKNYVVDGEKYKVVVDQLFLYTTVEVHVKIIPEG
ncbi:sporulation membrane protein YtrI [Fictibacillus sp. FJAT-27399]|uniref:sporulation membrane protein YtrI n=1 Tax=Fictibacillus sp. FJAT-27399 TaxID=1729689 RepID=UPI0007820208|nr:sporulation membrane protein YtrI [Fictibacillus sp. FJAT-27399]